MTLCLLTAATSQATQYYWNPPSGGTGTWDTSTMNWSSDDVNLDTTWNNGNNDDAVLQHTGGIFYIGTGGITVHNITANVNGYDLRNITAQTDVLTLAGTSPTTPTITVTNSPDTLTIRNVIAGTSGLILNGPGTLQIVNGANTYTGKTKITAGGTIYCNNVFLGTSGVAGALALLLPLPTI